MNTKDNRGFSLVELVIVIAIMAVLTSVVGVSYSRYLLKAKIMTDVTNAVTIRDALINAIADGTLEFVGEDTSSGTGDGVWIIVTKDQNSWPNGYSTKNAGYRCCFCGLNKNKKINGVLYNNSWGTFNKGVADILKSVGIDPDTLKVNASTEWDWYLVQVDFNKKTGEYEGYLIWSGKKGGQCNAYHYKTNYLQKNKISEIEKYL
ncbi:MAG: type II secretion system GspH family protein [Lachnospiraceae bacterium]|nr:type II secretion system GspH family protein [Lachnospiraceae bacterium]